MSSLSCMLILFCLNLLLTLAELKASDDGGTMEKEQGPKMVLQYVPVLVTNDRHTHTQTHCNRNRPVVFRL